MQTHIHGPDNAEFEIRKAYNTTIEAAVTYTWNREPIAGVDPTEVMAIYQRSFQCLRDNERLTAERWARTAKHLARAQWHEAKIAYLEPRANEIPFLPGAEGEEFNLHESADTTEDLLNCLADHAPPGMEAMPDEMKRHLKQARKHLSLLRSENYTHELLRAERLKAAHEYGRVVECMALAHEADGNKKRVA